MCAAVQYTAQSALFHQTSKGWGQQHPTIITGQWISLLHSQHIALDMVETKHLAHTAGAQLSGGL